jgi:ribonuclease HII
VGQDIGSGYPADPISRAYVKGYYGEHKEFPYFVRRSWKTTDDIIAGREPNEKREDEITETSETENK